MLRSNGSYGNRCVIALISRAYGHISLVHGALGTSNFYTRLFATPLVILNLFQDNMRRLFVILKQVQDDDGVRGDG